ncbi:MAG: ribosome silencing factor [Rhabdochlamydiaceae bacterium]
MSFLNHIAQSIYDKKGFNILCLDLQNVSTLTDHLFIAEGFVDRHVIAIAQHVEAELKKIGVSGCHIEGADQGDWVVMDYLNFMVHIFRPGTRELYQLEKLWPEAKIVDLEIKTEPLEGGFEYGAQ